MADAAPDAPVPRPRRRRSPARRIVVVATLVGAGLLVASVLVSADVQQAPPIASTVPPVDGAPCSAAATGTAALRTAHTYGSVVPGAVSVRLCNTNELGGSVPPDTLTTHVADLTDLINGLPRQPSDASCTMELGPHFALLFDYPDGTRSVVGGELDGCRVIAGRRGADTAVTAFLGWLLEQRRQVPPPVVDVSPTCGTTYPASSWLPPPVADTVRAVWCPVDSAAPHPIPWWATLRDAIAARAARSTGADGSQFLGTIIAASQSGERTVLWLNGTTVSWSARTPTGVVSMAATLPGSAIARLTAG